MNEKSCLETFSSIICLFCHSVVPEHVFDVNSMTLYNAIVQDHLKWYDNKPEFLHILDSRCLSV